MGRASRIATAFKRLRWEKEAALIPYLTVGYPSLDVTRQVVPVIARQGADLIELGIPFSDPMADGTTVQRASHAALENGVTVANCLEVAAEVRQANDVPLLFMTYYNPILNYGVDGFAADCATVGVDGLIVPDLPPEEAAELKAACNDAGIELIFLLAPTSTDERIERVTAMAGGFIYCVSLTGVTGARSEISTDLPDFLARVRKHTDLPLVVGFGISTAEQVARVAGIADGVVVGSALINVIEGLNEDDLVGGVGEFVRSLKEATVKASD